MLLDADRGDHNFIGFANHILEYPKIADAKLEHRKQLGIQHLLVSRFRIGSES